MSKKEILDLLNKADPKDFMDCLKDNLSRPASHYLMLKKIREEAASWRTLTAGCKAAAEIYFILVENEH